jgi:hypothetical protein
MLVFTRQADGDCMGFSRNDEVNIATQGRVVARMERLLRRHPALRDGDVWQNDLPWGLTRNEQDDSVPDRLLFVRKERALDAHGIRLPPDLIVQVLPIQGRRAGRRDHYIDLGWSFEYWAIGLRSETLTQWGRQGASEIRAESIVVSAVIPGLELRVSDLLQLAGR